MTEIRSFAWLAHGVLFAGALAVCCASVRAETLAVTQDSNGQLVYERDEHGNQIPDFSHCGYAGADREVPDVPIRVVVKPADGDDTARIQAAIDQVAELPLGEDGFRGAVLLAPGEFQIAGQLRIGESGIVLRGSGAGDGGTTLVATGTDRRAVLRIEGADCCGLAGGEQSIVDPYVPVGSHTLTLDSTDDFRVGAEVWVKRPSTAEWIAAIGMRTFGVGWRPGSRDIRWDRVITAIDGDMITLDAPITTAIDKQFGGGTLEYVLVPRIEDVGVEDLRLVSQVGGENPKDEDHAWFGVSIDNAQNAWVRRIEFQHFAGGAVALWDNTKWVTVEDCISLAPVSEIGGYRRHTFFTQGQLTLFLRCWSERGRHDFATGHCAAGPNAFVNCYASRALDDSGPLESWASGVLYDNVRIDGADLVLENRWSSPPGTGWAAANCVLWQCRAATVRCFRPPTANNWAIGCWADFAGDGTIQAPSDFVRPQSLYQAQLAARVGAKAAERVEPILGLPVGATNPTLEEAAKFVAQSDRPARQWIDVIHENMRKAQEQRAQERAARSEEQEVSLDTFSDTSSDSVSPTKQQLSLQNGWLVVGDALKTGGRMGQGFWRGSIRPGEAPFFGPAITRYVPGRVGLGFVDDLSTMTKEMQSRGIAVFDYHYGLWYDRRRDDHLMVRRADGDVGPPFYEQPFARSGRGTAWDGLSKYDLTKFNPWYWQRLGDFARLCDERGLVLVHQNYFQHNILEAGAHWADSPWRPANNVNDTGLPEPPPYIGDKRIFMAPNFYDVSDPRRHALHRGYIRQCLDNFADTSNVIQMTSAEYSGPLEFTRFWLDTIIEWEKEHGRDVIVALSAPKDVQDAILSDPERGPHVDVIDIRYWAYTAGDGLYAPAGGQNLAPRQHLRKTRLKPGGAAAVVKAVREYRTRYPDKAVLYHAEENCPSVRDGWAVLIGGGSLPDVKLPDELARILPNMQPADGIATGDGQWCLADEDGNYLIYAASTSAPIELHLPSTAAELRAHWIDPKSGSISAAEEVAARAGQPTRLPAKTNVLWLESTGRE
jgi:hypothetical protein